MQQKTIKNEVSIEGVGIHSGHKTTLTLKPAPVDHGIEFRRGEHSITVSPELVQEAVMCTRLVQGDTQFMTIEHLLSALAGLEVDNIIAELTSQEVPIMDGSAAPFVFLLESAGLQKLDAPRHFIRVKKTVRVEEGDKFAEFSPLDSGLSLMIALDYQDKVIANTSMDMEFFMQPSAFKKNIARARTYGFVKDLEYLHQNNLALGASLENAVGVTDTEVMNPEGLRYPDEFIRHKMLDAIGDLYLAGPIQGHFRAYKPGHALNNKLLRALMADETAWERV